VIHDDDPVIAIAEASFEVARHLADVSTADADDPGANNATLRRGIGIGNVP
jgi:hypothetical protein